MTVIEEQIEFGDNWQRCFGRRCRKALRVGGSQLTFRPTRLSRRESSGVPGYEERTIDVNVGGRLLHYPAREIAN